MCVRADRLRGVVSEYAGIATVVDVPATGAGPNQETAVIDVVSVLVEALLCYQLVCAIELAATHTQARTGNLAVVAMLAAHCVC